MLGHLGGSPFNMYRNATYTEIRIQSMLDLKVLLKNTRMYVVTMESTKVSPTL